MSRILVSRITLAAVGIVGAMVLASPSPLRAAELLAPARVAQAPQCGPCGCLTVTYVYHRELLSTYGHRLRSAKFRHHPTALLFRSDACLSALFCRWRAGTRLLPRLIDFHNQKLGPFCYLGAHVARIMRMRGLDAARTMRLVMPKEGTARGCISPFNYIATAMALRRVVHLQHRSEFHLPNNVFLSYLQAGFLDRL